MRRFLVSFALVAAALLAGAERPKAAPYQTCSAADPTDWVDDADDLQDCLDSGDLLIALSAGSPGYILEEHGLRLTRDGTHLTSGDPDDRARIYAHEDLPEFMIRADADDWRISHLVFDGNRFNRSQSCSYPNGHNILAYGDGFVIDHVDSSFAKCGSAMEMTGSNFAVYDNVVAYNGWSEDEYTGSWSDGMTVHRCTYGSITNNQIVENTDVGLVINRGTDCEIRWNEIWNYERYAFAGMHVSAGDDGYHTGGQYTSNEISSGYDMMGFGLVVGAHQWFHSTRTEDVGTVGWNTITGAVINLMVDGVDGGTVTSNSLSGAQGTRGLGTCLGQSALNYASEHNGSVTLDSGSTTRTCH